VPKYLELHITLKRLFSTDRENQSASARRKPMSVHPTKWLNDHEGDFIIRNYVFRSGETLPELKLHYRTLGTSKRDAAGKITNGVLLLQGNTGTGANWLRPSLRTSCSGRGSHSM
jgi:homoserine acetyltransferase